MALKDIDKKIGGADSLRAIVKNILGSSEKSKGLLIGEEEDE